MDYNISKNMIDTIISYLPVYISSYYILFYSGILPIKTINKTFICLWILSSTFLCSFISLIDISLSKIFLIILLYLSLAISKKSINLVDFCMAILFVGISFCSRTICVVIVGIILNIFEIPKECIINGIIIGLLNILLTIIIIKPRRISRSIYQLSNTKNIGFGLSVSGIIILLILINNNNNLSVFYTVAIAGCISILSIGLFLWIRKSITEHYRKKLQAKADEHYQNTLAEKEQQIEQLNNSNAFLSKIVHRDNHIMSSLQHTITKYKVCDNPSEKEKLMNEILTLAQERSDLIVKEQNNTKVLPTTGISLIDGALSNMYIKATAHNIDFNLIINQDIHYLINNLITQTDLETLLCDHIKDAIIAINSGEDIKGKILVTITMNDDIYEISIMDNGVDFEVDTLAKLGLERVTTHKDTGGSGIGFMTTFETLKKSNVSLIITENKTKTPFSKSITFRFDGLNAFIINSYRADLLKQSINRNDIIIM